MKKNNNHKEDSGVLQTQVYPGTKKWEGWCNAQNVKNGFAKFVFSFQILTFWIQALFGFVTLVSMIEFCYACLIVIVLLL